MSNGCFPWSPRGAELYWEGHDLELESQIPAKRRLLRLLGLGKRKEWVQEGDSFRSERGELTWRPDSVLQIKARKTLELELVTEFIPDYHAEFEGHEVGLDPWGGYGLYVIGSTTKGRAGLKRTLLPKEEIWIACYPTRQPHPERRLLSLAHEGRPRHPYPNDVDIAEAAQNCQVIALHAYAWKGLPWPQRPKFGRYAFRKSSWMTPYHEPNDPEQFEAFLSVCRERGLKVLLYLSPYYSRVPDIVVEAQRLSETYPIAGFYLDGVSDDIRSMDQTLSRLRKALGWDCLLYLNATGQPISSPRVPCFFLDAQVDFVLRGGAGRGGLCLASFFRNTVSGFNRSGAVGALV